jgi:four helix bundle protein
VAGESKSIRSYDDLLAWQKARSLVKNVYLVTDKFPPEERFGHTQQLRRAAVSVPSNIAEGYGRGAKNDYVRFLRMARGSLYEIQTQLLLAQDLGFLTEKQGSGLRQGTTQCMQLLHGLLRSLTKLGDDS